MFRYVGLDLGKISPVIFKLVVKICDQYCFFKLSKTNINFQFRWNCYVLLKHFFSKRYPKEKFRFILFLEEKLEKESYVFEQKWSNS